MSLAGDLRRINQETFVAFLDISGFKKYMIDGNAPEVLREYYQISFDEIERLNENRVENYRLGGLFISDSGIIFVRFGGEWIPALEILLDVIKSINIKMIERNHLTTCSIAFGWFQYENRISNQDVRKNPIYGQGYVNAFYDNEYGLKMRPGDCRILTKGFPLFPRDQDDGRSPIAPPDEDNVIRRVGLSKSVDGDYYHYYWMLDSIDDIETYLSEYRRIEQEKYENIKQLIKQRLEVNDSNNLSSHLDNN